MSSTWIYTLLLSLLLFSLPAKAQTFEDGYQSYVRNQFPVAELQFKNALKRATASEEKAFILKFIGICQYMRGDKRNAGGSFQQSLSLDRTIQIDADEVLDPSVVSFFMQIKSRMPPEVKKKPKAVAAAPVQTPGPSPVKKKVKKKKKSESSLNIADDQAFGKKRGIGILHFLPFGMPQIANESYLLGSGFAGLQLFAIYSIFDADKITTERQGLNEVVRTKEGLTDEQRDSFYKENNAYIGELKKQKNLALAGFSALWVISVAEGIINNKAPSAKTADDKPVLPQSTFAPIIQANRHGGGFGLSFQTELK